LERAKFINFFKEKSQQEHEIFLFKKIKSDQHKHKKTSSTGKSVEKRLKSTNDRNGTWETIAKAAEAEKMSAAKMSRSIKNNVVFNDEYYYAIQS
jgi:hypothetical protein